MYRFKSKNRIHKAGMLTALIFFGVGIYFTTGWSHVNNNETKCANHDNSAHRTHTITFEMGKVYEITSFTVKEGKQKQLNENYFPQVMPLVAEYGGAPLGMFGVTKKIVGEVDGQMIGIFEWPSLAVKNKFHRDPRFLKISPLRDEALSYFKPGFYEVSEDVTVAFKDNKVYEFFGAWLAPESGELLKQYFAISEPIKRSYGRPYPEFKVKLSPAKGQSAGAYAPHMTGIVEWDKADDYDALNANVKFKTQAAPLLKKAIAKMDMVQTKVIIKQQ